jgi:uncharacterized membrane protein YgcG
MKRLVLLLLAVVCPLLLGAVSAPVPPGRNIYATEYGSFASEEDRKSMALIAADLEAQTGTRLIYLSVETLDGLEPGEYANRVITDWELTDQDVLFFVYYDPEETHIYSMIGENLNGVWEGAVQSVNSDDIMAPYLALVRRLYIDNGAAPSPEIETLFAAQEPVENTGGNLGSGTVIFMAVMGVILARGFRLNRKYKQKYLKGHVRKRKSYLRTYNEEDEYNNEKIYKITYDDMD